MIRIIVAGLLAVPCFLVILAVAPIVAVLSLPSLWLLLFRNPPLATATATSTTTNEETGSSNQQQQQQHASHPDQVIIVGGSSGIGLAIARECVRRNIPKITLLARTRTKLLEAQTELQALAQQQQQGSTLSITSHIHIVAVDVTDYSALEDAAQHLHLPKTDKIVLWNCAGFSYPCEFLKAPIEKMAQQVQTNQLGTMYVVRAFLPLLHDGCIVLTSSAAGQVGVYGYTTYAPTKFAIRGFAEALHAEMVHSHPHVALQLVYPIDTDTPGYQEELKTTPELTKIISQSVGAIATADRTAVTMVQAAFCSRPKFQVYFNLEGWMLANLTSGMSPITHLTDAVSQIALNNLFRFISLFVLNDWWKTIRTYNPSNNNNTQNTPPTASSSSLPLSPSSSTLLENSSSTPKKQD